MSGKLVMEQNTGVLSCLTSAIPANTIGIPGSYQHSTRSHSAGTWSYTVELQYHSGWQPGWNRSYSYPCTAPQAVSAGYLKPQVAAINAWDVTHTCMLQSDWQWQCQRPWWTWPGRVLTRRRQSCSCSGCRQCRIHACRTASRECCLRLWCTLVQPGHNRAPCIKAQGRLLQDCHTSWSMNVDGVQLDGAAEG